MLVGTLGTPYEIQTSGTILFIEDVNVKPYQVDRMLMQLFLAGKFEGVRGIIFGEFTGTDAGTGEGLPQVYQRVLGPWASVKHVPVVYGLRSGHVNGGNKTLPIGVNARLCASDQVTLEILEPATQI